MIVLVTGARSGFGLLAAVSAARAGHTVYAGLRDVSTGDDLARAAGDLPVHPVQLDVTVAAERQAVVDRILAEHGRIDALVNNAGIAMAGPLEEVGEEDWRRTFEVNVFGLWELTRRVLPSMRAQKSGCVVNVSSMAGRMATPCLGVYAASKHAVSGLTEALRHEVRPFGVRVALVEPGPYQTDIFGRNKRIAEGVGASDSPYAPLVASLERLANKAIETAGDPQDVADVIVRILADPDPAYRHVMGPSTSVRRLARWALPDAAYEFVVRRTIERG